MTTCEMLRPTWGGWSHCGNPATLHMRIVHGGPDLLPYVCVSCVAIATTVGVLGARVAATHRIMVSCRHPHGEWHDDGCVLPVTVDTAEGLDVAVPA